MASYYGAHYPGWVGISDYFTTVPYRWNEEHKIVIVVDEEFADSIHDCSQRIEEQSRAKIGVTIYNYSPRPRFLLVTLYSTLQSLRPALSILTRAISENSAPSVDLPALKLGLVLHKDYCRWILRSDGSAISEIEESTGASYYISDHRHPWPNPSKKDVIIVGDPESVTNCTMKILEVLPYVNSKPTVFGGRSKSASATLNNSENTTGPSSDAVSPQVAAADDTTHPIEIMMDACRATKNVACSSQIQPSQMSPVNHSSTSISRSVTLEPTAVSVQSTSALATLSNSQNIAGPSSVGTPQAGAVSTVDGELATSEMQNTSTSRLAQLRDAILASFAEFKKANKTYSRSNESPDDCAICLCTMHEYKSFISGCLHVFCFHCIQEWVKKRSTCPICVREIKTVLNIRSQGDYNIQKLPDSRTRSNE